MKGIQTGSLCLIIPGVFNPDWDWVFVKVLGPIDPPSAAMLALNGFPVKYANVPWWHVEATDGLARSKHLQAKSAEGCCPESVLMPIDPLNDSARERAMNKPVPA